MSERMRKIEVPTEILDPELVESPEDQYSFELTKHETYRQEMLVTIIVKVITEVALSVITIVAALLMSLSQGPYTVMCFGLSVLGMIGLLFNSLASHNYNLKTLYKAHVKDEDVPEMETNDQIHILLVVIPFLAGIILSVFNL